MRQQVYTIAFVILGNPSAAQDVAVPSGLAMSLYDVILEEPTQTARFRFLVPVLATDAPPSFADVADDLEFLCNDLVIPGLAANDWVAKDVVISMSGAEVPFGQSAADVVQYFQPFRVENGTCIWEEF